MSKTSPVRFRSRQLHRLPLHQRHRRQPPNRLRKQRPFHRRRLRQPSQRRFRRRPSPRPGWPIFLPAAGNIPDLEAIQGRPAAGVDVGGAKDFDGLRTLWNALTTSHYGLFEGLHPIVAVRENSKSRTAELRLVAGPLTDVDIASRICATLAAAKRYCRLTPFEGQPLALNEPARRPAAAAKARPTVRAAP